MESRLTRKQFLRHAFGRTMQLAVDVLAGTTAPEQALPGEPCHALSADLPPELFELEARRLGLDPANRKEVLAAISRQLGRPAEQDPD